VNSGDGEATMLIIRDEQIAALGRTGRAVWGAEVSARIWTGQPELCSGKTWIEVRDWCRARSIVRSGMGLWARTMWSGLRYAH